MRLIHQPNHDLTYDDVFMIPSRFGVSSRMDVDLNTLDNTDATKLPALKPLIMKVTVTAMRAWLRERSISCKVYSVKVDLSLRLN